MASIKPAGPPSPNYDVPARTPGREVHPFATIENLLMVAYGLRYHQVIGPSWINGQRWDIVATMPPGTSKEQATFMLRNLLADRFKLKVHRETRDLPLYELVVAKGGPKLKASDASTSGNGRSRFEGRNWVFENPKATMTDLVRDIETDLDRPVVDKTGLSGTYDLKLTHTREALRLRGEEPNDVVLSTAIQEQLGLRLDAKTGPVDVLIVDEGQPLPTAN